MGKLLEQRNRALDDINAGRTVKKIRDLESRVRELEEENARLKRTNSSYANLTKAQESQLTNLRQRLYQLKGADSAIDSERQANCELTEQLATAQLNNKLLREALEAVKPHVQCDPYAVVIRALSLPASTEALDKHVAERVKEYGDEASRQMQHATKAVWQRDLAVEALKTAYEVATNHDDRLPFDWAVYCEMLWQAIKESEEN